MSILLHVTLLPRCYFIRLLLALVVVVVVVNNYLAIGVTALDNGLALTPPMGISTWSIFRGDVNHTLIMDLANSISNLGLNKIGYEYLLMDAGWAADDVDPNCTSCLPYRDKNGNLIANKQKFPYGLKATTNYVHSKDLKFGIWFGVGMCKDTSDDVNNNNNHNNYNFLLRGQQRQDNSNSNNNTAITTATATTTTISTTTTKQPDYAELDAIFFASMGIDAVKHDDCDNEVANTTDAIMHNYHKYQRMSQALNRTGRPILYDVTLQVHKQRRTVPSYDYNYIWSPEPYGAKNVQSIANMWWSVPVNKYNCWNCCVHPNEYIVPNQEDCNDPTKLGAWRGLLPMLDIQDLGVPGWSGHWDWAGPKKGWNHLDQLSVCIGKSWYGPGLTQTEQISQISLWAIMAAPLIISVDTRFLSKDDFCYKIITNQLLIQVHQDPLGIPGRPIKNNYYYYFAEEEEEDNDDDDDDDDDGTTYNNNNNKKIIDTQVWARPLRNGTIGVVFFNRAEENRTMNITFEELGLSTSIKTVTTTNVWQKNQQQQGKGKIIKNINNVSSPITVSSIIPHGVIFLIVTPEEEVVAVVEEEEVKASINQQ